MATRYLVTGGAGFIGSHIVQRLVAEGQRVRVLDNLSTGRWENLSACADRVEFIDGSICEMGTCERACRGIKIVIHQAALGSVARSVLDPARTHAVNVDGTLNVLLAARGAGARRVVVASSSSVYGNTVELPKHEGMTPMPLSPYAVSKLAVEHYARVFHHIYGLETVALRYFNVFGPRQDTRSEYAAVVPRFVLAALERRPPTIHGDGTQSRDFTYVENVVEANLLACRAPGAPGHVMNVGAGERHSLREMVAALAEMLGHPVEPVFTALRPGDVQHSLADIRLAERLLGYRPPVHFREGLERTVAYFASLPATPAPPDTSIAAPTPT